MSDKKSDIVDEYLREVEVRLSGLPLLQRRELLADLESHIATTRQERDARSDGELLEILERLGSPEVVAAAAYEQTTSSAPRPVADTRRRLPSIWVALVVALVALTVLGCAGLLFNNRSSSDIGPSLPASAPATFDN